MERNQELFEKIELYLSDSLSSSELQDFENALENNSSLQREVELHRFLEAEIKDVDSLAFRRKLIGIRKKKKKPFRWVRAASIVVLLGTITTFWLLSRVENVALFDEYYNVYPAEDVIRGGEKSKEEKVLRAYDNKKFYQVIPELKLLISSEPKNELWKLYLGNAYLKTEQIAEAILVFKEVDQKSVYYEDAQWYLALSYIKLDIPDLAVPILKDVVKSNGRHEESANVLLNELK